MSAIAFQRLPLGRRGNSISAGAPCALRVRVWLTRWKLDRDIAGGCPPQWSEMHALRARQLTHMRTRASVAASLRGIVEYADRVLRQPGRRCLSAVVIEPSVVNHDREALLGLAERLDGPSPVSPRGVAIARALLVNEIGSPLFDSSCQRALSEIVWEVADALGSGPATAES